MTHDTLPKKLRTARPGSAKHNPHARPAAGPGIELPSTVPGMKLRLDPGNRKSVPAPKSDVRVHCRAAVAVEQVDVADDDL